ncbi:DeoR/GlpR family DNA-binding transcription regulator [Tundrisphaera lichenicola]|uniref:DeoR/GlpR family DNA-binding transcription regulator n=1 Tax=Tundrisphaera lichenicola TaxID=2029860 RepID=UPI003EB92D26
MLVKKGDMLAEPRRKLLLDRIARQGFATLDELVKSLGVSESTVRRDLEALDLAGVVKRTHGGAVFSASEARAMPAFDERTDSAAREKRAIGQATASLIDDGDTVLLDGGTTTLEVARALLGRPVQIVTNSLPIAQLSASSKEIDLILIGGYVYPRTGVALGPLAISMMQGIRVRKAILGAGGIVSEGVYNSNLLLVETERQMMACGQEVMIVADHSKFGRLSLAFLCGLDAIDDLVVDPGISEADRAMVEAAGVKVHLADLPLETTGSSKLNGPRTEA